MTHPEIHIYKKSMKAILSLDDFLKQAKIDMDFNEDEEGIDLESSPEMDQDQEEVEIEIEEPEEDEKEEEEDDDEEKEEADEEKIETPGEMAFGQLERCIDYSKMLRERIKPGDEVEPWIAAKITKAMDYLQSVYNYLDGLDGEEEEVEEGDD